jgi:VWFA-related protein
MHQPTARCFKPIASLLLAAAIPAIAQPPAPTLKLTTRLTQVDITATDIKGHPIHGLTQSDFTVKEDGKPQPIKNFEEFGTAQPAAAEPPPQLPPNVYTNAQPQAPTTDTINVLLIDNVTTGSSLRIVPENVAAATREATKYLKTMPAGTQVILLDLTSQLQIVQPLTTDRDVLLAALHSVVYKQNFRTSLPCIIGAPCQPTLTDLCNVRNAQSQLVVGGLQAASAYLAGIKGRKNILWFTPGIPWLTDFPSYEFIPCMQDYTPELQRDYNLLAASQAALYPVDPRGIDAPFPSGFPPSVSVSPRFHISMEDIADATGGQAYYNTNDLASAIGKAITAGTDSYSLSYIPPLPKYDGQYHKISVSVDRPGITLEYRRGYTSIDPASVPLPPTQNASTQTAPPSPDAALYASMAHGAAPSTQILFTVAVTPSAIPAHPGDPVLGQINPTLKLKGKPLVRYDFNYTLSPDQITLTDAPNSQRQGAIEFTVAAYDGTGEMLNVIRQTASITLTPFQLTTFYQREIPMHLQLDLPPGPIFLRAAIRDIPSNKLGTLEIPLTVAR